MVPIVIGAVGAISKGLVKELEDLEIRGHPEDNFIKINHNTEKEPRRVGETCRHSNSSGKPSAHADVKNSQKRNNNKKS